MNYKSILISSLLFTITFSSLGMEVEPTQEAIKAASFKLLHASKENNIDEVKRLIAEGIADITVKDEFGKIAFVYALQNRNEELVQILLDAMVNCSKLRLQALVSQAEKFNHNNPFFILPSDLLGQIISYGQTQDSLSVDYAFIKVGAKSDDQAKLLENNIKNFMRLSTVCKNFNKILTPEVIGNFCKNYAQKDKDQALKTLMGNLSKYSLPILILTCSGADVNMRDRYDRTLIESAIQVYSCLFSSNEKQALFKIIQTLVENGSTQKDKALLCAVERDLCDVVTLLIKAGADVNAVDEYGNTVLFYAAGASNLEVVKALIEADANVNMRCNHQATSLMRACNIFACDSSCINVAKALALIEAGADINMMTEIGDNALISAIIRKNTELSDVLTNAGASLNAGDTNQRTALMLACATNHTFLVEAFIKAGADVNAVDKDGNTALFYAAKEERTELIKTLIKAGADVNAVDKDGNTVLTLAIHSYFSSVKIGMAIINPTLKSLARKSIETLLMIYRNVECCLSELPQEVLKIIISTAYPEYAIDPQITACLDPQVLVDVVPLETLSMLIKNGTLNRETVVSAWQKKLRHITQGLNRSKKLSDTQIQSFETDVLKTIEASLK